MAAQHHGMAAQHQGDEPASDGLGRKATGAEAKVEEWVGKWRAGMVKVAADVLGDIDAAEDIAQEAFMKALHIARSDPAAVFALWNPRAWLVKLTRILASGVLRTKRRRHRLRRENADEIRKKLFPDRYAGKEEESRVERVLETAERVLTNRQLEVFRLAWTGMEEVEIAHELKLSRVTVRRHQTDAIRRLQEHIVSGGR
ncbi:MAG: sigma-70 family RNA polymerase sigma factor [Gemmatimonadota bacterium]|nr:sigma-70 family RNA polymerase sigma factor [bacterium]MDE2983193.1 sigma-70 family RNA polymerase sigma factor [Gemmatimonadota bacterium]